MRCLAAGLGLALAAGAQVSVLQIRVVGGEGTVHSPGARSIRSLTVAVTDESGKPVPGAAVSFHLPESGPGGSFANGLRTDVAITDARGYSTVRAFLPNRIAGRFQIRILVSKEQARAGTVSFQYVGESPATARATRSKGKWIALAAAAAGGSFAAAMASRGSRQAAAPAPIPAAPAPVPVLTIGTPSISVGRP